MQQFMILILLSIASLSFAQTNIDPFEDMNRSVYQFNQELDNNILKPTAKAYQDNVPKAAQKGVSNFFGNLGDISTFTNQVLQFKPIESVTTLGRVLVNSTIGLAGLLDVASEVNLTTRDEDFGQTMGVWGAESGPYVMLPLLGPSSVRDGAGVAVDLGSPHNVTRDLGFLGSVGANAIHVIDRRAKLSFTIDLVNQTDDPYVAIRSSYLQKRKFDTYDGNLLDEYDF